jgi:hypothetical protein
MHPQSEEFFELFKLSEIYALKNVAMEHFFG